MKRWRTNALIVPHAQHNDCNALVGDFTRGAAVHVRDLYGIFAHENVLHLRVGNETPMHEHRARESEEQKESCWGDGKGRPREEEQEALEDGSHGDPC